MGLENHPINPKLWKTARKRKNDEFLVVPLGHRMSVMGLVNDRGNPKLWTISHENRPKT
jgi:hypothetical protein